MLACFCYLQHLPQTHLRRTKASTTQEEVQVERMGPEKYFEFMPDIEPLLSVGFVSQCEQTSARAHRNVPDVLPAPNVHSLAHIGGGATVHQRWLDAFSRCKFLPFLQNIGPVACKGAA